MKIHTRGFARFYVLGRTTPIAHVHIIIHLYTVILVTRCVIIIIIILYSVMRIIRTHGRKMQTTALGSSFRPFTRVYMCIYISEGDDLGDSRLIPESVANNRV